MAPPRRNSQHCEQPVQGHAGDTQSNDILRPVGTGSQHPNARYEQRQSDGTEEIHTEDHSTLTVEPETPAGAPSGERMKCHRDERQADTQLDPSSDLRSHVTTLPLGLWSPHSGAAPTKSTSLPALNQRLRLTRSPLTTGARSAGAGPERASHDARLQAADPGSESPEGSTNYASAVSAIWEPVTEELERIRCTPRGPERAEAAGVSGSLCDARNPIMGLPPHLPPLPHRHRDPHQTAISGSARLPPE